MAKNAFSTVISVNPEDSGIVFYSCVGADKNSLRYDAKTYKAQYFSEDFFSEFARCLREYANSNPSYAGKSAFVTVLLPDSLISTGSFNIPGVNKRNTDNLFKVAVEGLYPNLSELKLHSQTVKQNKQYSTIAVSIIRQKLVQDVYTACSGANMFAKVLSFKANGAACGAINLNPKLKGDSFVLLDLHEKSSVMAFVSKSTVLGCIGLPFGWSLLQSNKIIAENMLFNHDVAELAVLNAKEKAKAKQLTMMGGSDAAVEAGAEASEEGSGVIGMESSGPAVREIGASTIKTLPRKTPRVLPKFMQRPVPDTQEGITFENFRVFVKYVLEFIRLNPTLTNIAQPSAVYVNMPDSYDFLYDLVNTEAAENKVKFLSLGIRKEKPVVTEHLELYGGLFLDQFGQLNNF